MTFKIQCGLKHYGTHLLSFDNFLYYSENASLLPDDIFIEKGKVEVVGWVELYKLLGVFSLLVLGIFFINIWEFLSLSAGEWRCVYSSFSVSSSFPALSHPCSLMAHKTSLSLSWHWVLLFQLSGIGCLRTNPGSIVGASSKRQSYRSSGPIIPTRIIHGLHFNMTPSTVHTAARADSPWPLILAFSPACSHQAEFVCQIVLLFL